jgi:hypothetical protein
VPDLAPDLPAIVATIGLHGSASTWVYNVVREIMLAAVGPGSLLAGYADDITQLPDTQALVGRHLLVKSHHAPAALDEWLAARQARIVLSIRDPRDACLSMVQRFGLALDEATRVLLRDCERMIRLTGAGHMVLRYEDRFFEQPDTVASLASGLGIALQATSADTIFARYATGAVRAFAAGVTALPPERVGTLRHSIVDRVTQIHATHIGDTNSGKWRAFPPPLLQAMNTVLGPFLDRFGYPRAA